MTINGIAPYWRAALEQNWGDHSWEIGTYGMSANVIPNASYGFGTDNYTDIAFNSQYQWISDMNAVTVRANYIMEKESQRQRQSELWRRRQSDRLSAQPENRRRICL